MTDAVEQSGASGSEPKIRFYRFKNRLHIKTGLPPGTTVKLSPEALRKAQGAIDEMAQDYPDWAMGQVDQLAERHKKAVFSVPARTEHYKEINRIAHDIKGQGGTFGYPIISTIAESLYRTTGEQARFTDPEVEVVKAHIDSLRVILQNREKDPESQTGQRVQRALDSIIRKLR